MLAADGGADHHRGACRWWPVQRKEAWHGMALKDGLRWSSEEEEWSSGEQ
jgi:hypothetical protein